MLDDKKTRILRKKLRSLGLRIRNDIRYRYPGPKQAAQVRHLDQAVVERIWDGILPEAIKLEDRYHASHFSAKTVTFSKPFVACLPEGRVFGWCGDVITREGQVLTDVCPEFSTERSEHSLTKRGRMPLPEQIDATVAALSCSVPANYFHWVFDCFARLKFLRQSGVSPEYYYVDTEKPFQKEFLELAGIPKQQILPAGRHKHILAKKLLVTSLPGDDFHRRYWANKDPETCRFIRNSVPVTANSLPHSKYVYIQRKGKRVLRNEAEMIELLTNKSEWRVIQLESHSVREQASLFNNASVILGVHGAGLSNLVFAGDTTTVIEIGNPNYRNDLFCQLAGAMNVNYRLVIAKTTGSSRRNHVAGNLNVNPADVMSIIHEVCAD